VFPPFLFIVSYLTSKLGLFDMFWIDAVKVTTGSNARENWFIFVYWLGKGFRIELTLPREALSIPVLDDKGLAHSTV
jgi:hypothetical protein